jgi:hypothetical protein
MDTNEILKNADDLVLSASAGEADATNNFCTIWPTAKPGLEMLRDLVKSPFVKVAISAVIAAGDAASSKICG